MQFKRNLVLIALLLWSARAVSSSDISYQEVSLAKLRPEASLATLLDSDQPSRAMEVGQDGALRILGQSFLWKWYPLTGSVSRVGLSQIGLGDRDSRADLGIIGSDTFVFSDRRLHVVDIENGRTKSFSSVLSKDCKRAKFVSTGNVSLLVLTCGIFKIDLQNLKLVKLESENALSFDNLLAPSDCSCVVSSKGKEIYRHDLVDGGRLVSRTLYSAKAQVGGLDLVGGRLAVWTSRTLLSIDLNDGQLKEVVPTGGGRRVKAAGFSEGVHVFLFADGVMELYDPLARKAYATSYKVTDNAKFIMDPGSAFAIVVSENAYEVLGLDGLGRG
jgi:hypothetical protein